MSEMMTMSIQKQSIMRIDQMASATDRLNRSMRMSTVLASSTSLTFGFVRAAQAASQASNQVDNLADKQSKAAKEPVSLKDAWDGVSSAIANATGFIQNLANSAKVVAAQADSYANMQTRLGLINDGTQTQAELQNKVYQAAQRSHGAYGDMANTVSKLGLSAGGTFGSNDELIQFSELAQKSFVMSGTAPEDQQAGMNQLVQSMGTGSLQGGDFNSLMVNAPMLAQAIADFTGKSNTELMQMSANGAISADMMKNAMFSASDEINGKFAQMPMTFSGAMTTLQNSATMAFGPAMEKINALLNSPQGAAVMNAVAVALSYAGAAASFLVDVLTAIVNFFVSNWSVIEPILITLAFVLLGVVIAMLWAMVPPLIASAIAWLTMNWPILLIVGLIVLLVGMLGILGVSFSDVCGFVGGILGGLYAFVYNLIADIWNFIAVFAEFFANIFNDPIGSIVRLFIGLADFVLGVIETIANGIDAVFGGNLAGTVSGWRKGMQDWANKNVGESKIKIPRMEKLDAGTVSKQWSEGGKAFGDKVQGAVDGIANLTKPKGTDQLGNPTLLKGGGGNDVPDVGRVGSVGKVDSDVNISDEDLQFLRDVAEMRFLQNFVTLTPTVAVDATISERVNIDEVVGAIETRLEEEFAVTAEGVYA